MPENALRGLIAGKRPSDEVVGAGIADVLRDGRIDVAERDEARRQGALRGRGLRRRGERDGGGDAYPRSAATNDRGTTHRNGRLGRTFSGCSLALINPRNQPRRAAAV